MRTDPRVLLAALIVGAPCATRAIEVTPVGRLHLDYGHYDSDVTQFDNRSLVRRAQFGLETKFNDDWSVKTVYEFASGGSVKDAYLRYSGGETIALTLGQAKVPFGLEQLESTNDITFLERSLPSSAFTLARRKGLGVEQHGTHHTLALMGFGSSIGGNEGSGVAARFTYNPIKDGENLIHLGIAATTEHPTESVSFDARPEAQPTTPRLVRTGTVSDVVRIGRWGGEAAWKNGPFSVQAEWMRSYLSRNQGKPDLSFDGGYVSGSWVLTGESRAYKQGVFHGITPVGKYGAWELTARFSRLGLDDGTIRGGKENNLSVGMNWYFRDNARVMINYIRAHSDRRGISDNPNIIDVRLQFSF